MIQRYPTHPVVFLESVVHLMLGAILLAKSPFANTTVGVLVALVFVLLGLGFAVPAVGRYWVGAFSIVDDMLVFRSGLFKRHRREINRSEIVEIKSNRGARWLRVDPIHALLGRVVNYGSVTIQSRDRQTVTLHPVAPDATRAIIEAWWEKRDVPAARQPSRALLPLTAALVFAAYAGGVLTADGPALSMTMPVLLICAAVFELAFWVSLFSVNRHAVRRP